MLDEKHMLYLERGNKMTLSMNACVLHNTTTVSSDLMNSINVCYNPKSNFEADLSTSLVRESFLLTVLVG